MRTAQQDPRKKNPQLRGKRWIRRAGVRTARENSCGGWVLLCAAAFLAGYLPGMGLGRGGDTPWGQQLAAYYLDISQFSTWLPVFTDQIAAAFLQLMLVVLCGFSSFGQGLLPLLFAGRGCFLGVCAANVASAAGAKGIVTYWLLSCLPDLSVLLIGLWLSGHALVLSRGLFQDVFLGGAPRGQLGAAARRLSVRAGTAFLAACLLSVFCSGLCVLLARFLL